MKKVFLFIVVILLLLLISVSFFIPAQLTVSEAVFIRANPTTIFRVLSDKKKWSEWWPAEKNSSGTDSIADTAFSFDNSVYQLNNFFYNRVQLLIRNKEVEDTSFINLIPIHSDSVAIEWKCELLTGWNPIKKLFQYQRAKDIKSDMDVILDSLHSFLNKTENVYGFPIQRTTLKDTVLVATRAITKEYPTTTVIYKLVHTLHEYIAGEGAAAVSYPMLNVSKGESGTYETMVGIPTNKALKGNSSIFYRRFFSIPDKMLLTEVKGGPATIQQAHAAITNYMSDHQLSLTVIPFEYLVTDRSKVPDTIKWVTRIYYPIF